MSKKWPLSNEVNENNLVNLVNLEKLDGTVKLPETIKYSQNKPEHDSLISSAPFSFYSSSHNNVSVKAQEFGQKNGAEMIHTIGLGKH